MEHNGIPMNKMEGGKELEKLMEDLGITRNDLKPAMILPNDEVVDWLKRFGGRLKT